MSHPYAAPLWNRVSRNSPPAPRWMQDSRDSPVPSANGTKSAPRPRRWVSGSVEPTVKWMTCMSETYGCLGPLPWPKSVSRVAVGAT